MRPSFLPLVVPRGSFNLTDARGGTRERYADRHWFLLDLEDGTRLEAHVLRRVRSRREPRWWGRVIEANEG